jgi:hypothetical protein
MPPHPRTLEAQPQVVQVWFEPAQPFDGSGLDRNGPATLITVHGQTRIDGDVLTWSTNDNPDVADRVFRLGGRLLIRIHCGHLFAEDDRPFSAALDAASRQQTLHAPGGVHETWIFVAG